MRRFIDHVLEFAAHGQVDSKLQTHLYFPTLQCQKPFSSHTSTLECLTVSAVAADCHISRRHRVAGLISCQPLRTISRDFLCDAKTQKAAHGIFRRYGVPQFTWEVVLVECRKTRMVHGPLICFGKSRVRAFTDPEEVWIVLSGLN